MLAILGQASQDWDMKSLIIGAALLSSIYVGATKILMSQLDGLKDFYSHMDRYTSQVLDQNTDPITPPDSVQKMQNQSAPQQLPN